MQNCQENMPPEDLRAYLLAVLQVEDGVQLGREGQEKKAGQGYNATKGERRGISRDGGVARGILRALQELVKVGKGIEEEVWKWVKEDIEYRGRWLKKEGEGEVGPETEVETGVEPEPAIVEEAGEGEGKGSGGRGGRQGRGGRGRGGGRRRR